MSDFKHIPSSLLPTFHNEIKRNIDCGNQDPSLFKELKQIKEEVERRGIVLPSKKQ